MLNIDAVKSAIESLYDDTCDIIEQVSVEDPVTHKTRFDEALMHEKCPCRISYSSFPENSGDNVSEVSQAVKLFIDPGISIKPGSKIIVTRGNGDTTAYASSGKPAIHSSHQEINLELFERWS